MQSTFALGFFKPSLKTRFLNIKTIFFYINKKTKNENINAVGLFYLLRAYRIRYRSG